MDGGAGEGARGLAQPAQQQADGDEVPVLESLGYLDHARRRGVAQGGDQLADRHGGDDVVRRQALALARAGILDRHRAHPTTVWPRVHRPRSPAIRAIRCCLLPARRRRPPAVQLQPHRPLPEANLAAEGDHPRRHRLPHLPWPEFGVEKALDQAGIDQTRPAAQAQGRKRRLQGMEQGAGHAQPLDALRPPLGADPGAGHAPHLFGVVLEEGLVQLPPKAVEQKVLQRHLRPARKGPRPGVAAQHPPDPKRAQLEGGIQVGLDRIGEEATFKIDARQAVAYQQHLVGGVRAKGCAGLGLGLGLVSAAGVRDGGREPRGGGGTCGTRGRAFYIARPGSYRPPRVLIGDLHLLPRR